MASHTANQKKWYDKVNDPDRYPDDDYWIEYWKCTILNRIDREWGCDQIVDVSESGPMGFPIYCELPEHDPFTNRCWDHTPGNLSSGYM